MEPVIPGLADSGRELEARSEAPMLAEVLRVTLLETIPFALYVTDNDGVIRFYNDLAARIWGRSPVTGQDRWTGALKLYCADGSPIQADASPLALLLKGKMQEAAGQEVIIERPDRSKASVTSHARLLHDKNDRVIGAIDLMEDISDRKQNESAQAHLAAIVESSHDAIIGKDLSGIITSWNKAAERLYGYTAEEMVGRSIYRVIPQNRRSEEETIIRRIKEGKATVNFDTMRIRKDATEVPVSLTVSPIRNSRGQIIGASKTARDITDRRSVEGAIQESMTMLNTVFDLSSTGICVIDQYGLFVKVNRHFAQMLEYEPVELVGKHFLTIVAPEEHIIAQNRLQMRSWDSMRDAIDYTAVTRTRQKKIVQFQSAGGGTYDGTPITVSVATDVTQQRRYARNQTFLLKTSEVLSTLLDLSVGFQQLANVITQYFADWTIIDLVDENGLCVPRYYGHSDQNLIPLVQELRSLYPEAEMEKFGPANIVRLARPRLVRDIPESIMNPEGNGRLKEIQKCLKPHSYIHVPLRSSGRVLGTIAFVRSDGNLSFNENDLEVATHVGAQAATAMENHNLYTELQAAYNTLRQRTVGGEPDGIQ